MNPDPNTLDPDTLDPNTPVLVGVGLTMQRQENASLAKEPIDLMIAAANTAGSDCSCPALLKQVERISLPVGRWAYRNPGKMIANEINAERAISLSALVGVSQQTLLSDTCTAIANGELSTALVVGGEAGYRLQRAGIDGIKLANQESVDTADIVMKPQAEIFPDYEQRSGLGQMAVGYYAILDSAFRHAAGISTNEYRDRIANRYSRFSTTASENEHAWDRTHHPAAEIRDPSTRNPMLAFPYTKLHNSQWSVDQASALLFCSVGKAQACGIPREKWVFPQVFSEANHMLNITARGDLDRCVGAEVAAKAALDAAGCGSDEFDFTELYSCFPIAVESYAKALNVPDHTSGTFTGGMPFGGGPFNNFVLHAVAQLANRIRSKPHSRGLVTTVSGILTKQGFGVWGAEPISSGYQFLDVTNEVRDKTDEREVDAAFTGKTTVAGYTVLYKKDGSRRGIAVVDLPNGKRSIGGTANDDLIDAMESTEFCGTSLNIDNGELAAS